METVGSHSECPTMSNKPSYEERLQASLKSDDGEDPDEVVPDRVRHYSSAYAVIFIGVAIGSNLIIGPIVTFGLLMCLAALPLFATATGRAFRRDFARRVRENMEENQQSSSESRSQKRLCQACGWQNPPENAYCHDCGTELGKSE